MAEGLFKAMVKGRADFIVESAGVHAMEGQRASQHTVNALKDEGISLADFRSQPLTKHLINDATHIFVMTQGHRDVIEAMFPKAAEKTYLVTEFTADDELRGEDVPDPIGLGKAVYVATKEVLKKSLPSILGYIEKTSKPSPAPPEPTTTAPTSQSMSAPTTHASPPQSSAKTTKTTWP